MPGRVTFLSPSFQILILIISISAIFIVDEMLHHYQGRFFSCTNINRKMFSYIKITHVSFSSSDSCVESFTNSCYITCVLFVIAIIKIITSYSYTFCDINMELFKFRYVFVSFFWLWVAFARVARMRKSRSDRSSAVSGATLSWLVAATSMSQKEFKKVAIEFIVRKTMINTPMQVYVPSTKPIWDSFHFIMVIVLVFCDA